MTPSFVLATALAIAPAVAALDEPSPDPQQASIESIRTLGRALYAWYGDHYSTAFGAAADGRQRFDLAEIPRLSGPELRHALVPTYLTEVPERDGWGRPFDVRLFQGRRGELVMAVRSAGSDGRWEATSYTVGDFPVAETEHDLVWVDGYFVRWPSR